MCEQSAIHCAERVRKVRCAIFLSSPWLLKCSISAQRAQRFTEEVIFFLTPHVSPRGGVRRVGTVSSVLYRQVHPNDTRVHHFARTQNVAPLRCAQACRQRQIKNCTHNGFQPTYEEFQAPRTHLSQHLFHDASIFRLLLKVAVRWTFQCDYRAF